MSRALTISAVAAFALAAVMVGAPHPARADTNGICLINGQQIPASAADGTPILPDCSSDRHLQVMSIPDPSSPPTQVQVISLPSSAPNTYPTPIPFPSVQTVNVNNFPTPVPVQPISAPTNLPVVQPAAKYTVLSAAGTTSITGAKVFLGAANISTSAQITAVTCYDNASAASGTVILSTTLGLTNPWFPSGGIGLANGLTCNVPLLLLGNGIAIYTRTF